MIPCLTTSTGCISYQRSLPLQSACAALPCWCGKHESLALLLRPRRKGDSLNCAISSDEPDRSVKQNRSDQAVPFFHHAYITQGSALTTFAIDRSGNRRPDAALAISSTRQRHAAKHRRRAVRQLTIWEQEREELDCTIFLAASGPSLFLSENVPSVPGFPTCHKLGVLGDRMKTSRVRADYNGADMARIEDEANKALANARAFKAAFVTLNARYPL